LQILSFDVGGTKIAWGIVDESGKLLAEVRSIPTPQNAAEIEDFFKKTIKEFSADGFAVATAGVVFNNQLQGKPNNLPAGYEKIDFAALFGAPYIVENDATSALYAEWRIGALRGVNYGVMLTLGTDVGCGIICNGEIVRGKTGAAGEYPFDFSGRALQKLAREHNLPQVDCFEILQQVKQGNETARTVYRLWEERMLDAMSMLNRLLDVEMFALSGSVSKIADYAKINTALKILEPHNPPLVKPAECGTNAGLIGAALLCAEKMKGK